MVRSQTSANVRHPVRALNPDTESLSPKAAHYIKVGGKNPSRREWNQEGSAFMVLTSNELEIGRGMKGFPSPRQPRHDLCVGFVNAARTKSSRHREHDEAKRLSGYFVEYLFAAKTSRDKTAPIR